jgi:hypothetical protein
MPPPPQNPLTTGPTTRSQSQSQDLNLDLDLEYPVPIDFESISDLQTVDSLDLRTMFGWAFSEYDIVGDETGSISP